MYNFFSVFLDYNNDMEINDKVVISKYVSAKRVSEGLTIRAFAEKYNVSKSTIERYEKGLDDDPSPLKARKFCKTFGISLDAFIDGFYYTNPAIDTVLNTAQQFDEKFNQKFKKDFYPSVYANFYDQYYQEFGLHDFVLTTEKDSSATDEYELFHGAECLDSNNNTVFMHAYIRGFVTERTTLWMRSRPILSYIEKVSTYSEETLGANQFVLLIKGKRVYDYIKSLKFNSSNNHCTLVLYTDDNSFVEYAKLF